MSTAQYLLYSYLQKCDLCPLYRCIGHLLNSNIFQRKHCNNIIQFNHSWSTGIL